VREDLRKMGVTDWRIRAHRSDGWKDLRKMGVTDWRIRAHRKDGWKMVVKEAKVLQGL
jgi:hypothetical protein